MYIQLLVLLDIVPDRVEHDLAQEQLRLIGFHVGYEDFSRGAAGVGGPFFWVCEREDPGPCGKGWYDFEEFGERAGFVGVQQETDSDVRLE